MKAMKKVSTWVWAVLLTSATATRGQNLILDGSFESPQQSAVGSYLSVTPANWTGGVRLINGNGNQISFPNPEQGNQYEGIESTSLSQTFNVLNSGTYLLTWYDDTAANDFYTDSVSITSSGLSVYTNTFQAVGNKAWNKHSVALNLVSGSDTLTFTGGSEGLAHLIDNVSLVQVPEHANSLVLFGFSTMGMALAFLTKTEKKSNKMGFCALHLRSISTFF